jgi:hypothetical protein
VLAFCLDSGKLERGRLASPIGESRIVSKQNARAVSRVGVKASGSDWRS